MRFSGTGVGVLTSPCYRFAFYVRGKQPYGQRSFFTCLGVAHFRGWQIALAGLARKAH
ncbi:hypothetical protein MC862_001617 [Proteus mirabilis]|uniref:hypothetical protein n=1 Tax=Proteus mirabilis TaxID=584 RepID=UPI002A5C8EB7|nr:hypothetical protein [Proteus mirabilis]